MEELYDFNNEIGKGNFATVFLGTEKETGQQYAVKAIDKQKFEKFTANRNTELNLDSEQKMLESLRHPHIVEFKALYANAKEMFLVTEYMGGGDLLQYSRTAHLGLDGALDPVELADDAADADGALLLVGDGMGHEYSPRVPCSCAPA